MLDLVECEFWLSEVGKSLLATDSMLGIQLFHCDCGRVSLWSVGGVLLALAQRGRDKSMSGSK